MLDSGHAAALEALRASPIFQAAPSADLERLAPCCTVQRYPRGAAILPTGSVAASLLVVGRGRIKAVALSPNAEADLVVAILRPGDVFGEPSLFNRIPMLSSLTAIGESEVAFVPRADLLALMERRPAVAIAMITDLCEKMRVAVEMAVALRFLDMPSRLYRRLQLLGRFDSRRVGNQVRIQHGLSQQELADAIGASREALNKLLTDWRRDGLIDYGRGFIAVTDPDGLARRLPAAMRQQPGLTAPLGELAIFGESEPAHAQRRATIRRRDDDAGWA